VGARVAYSIGRGAGRHHDDQVSAPLRRNRNFGLLWVGQSLSDVGSAASSLAYPLLVLALTHSATLAGVVGTTALAVSLVGRLPAGALADRHDRRLLMLGCDMIRGIAVTGVAVGVLSHHIDWPVILVVASLDGVGGVLFDAAASAAIPMLVEDEHLEGAWAATQARSQAAEIAGPPLGGALFGFARALPFVTDAVSYLISVITVAGMRGRFTPARPPERAPMHREIADAFALIWRTPLLRAFVLQAPLINFAFIGVAFTVPVALRLHGVHPAVIGAVQASMSVGALIGAVFSSAISRRLRLSQLIIGITAMSTLLLTVATVLIPSPLVALPLVMMGLLAPAANTGLLAKLGRSVPEHQMGRVMSNLQFAGLGPAVAAPILAGVVVAHIGDHTALGLFAVAEAAAAAVAITQRRAWTEATPSPASDR
jgi:MFS family permease